MNPFKHKRLEEFTMEDCELYISTYSHGERIREVTQLLKKLKKQKASQVKEGNAADSKKKDIPDKAPSPIVRTAYNWTKFFRIIGTIIVIVITILMAATTIMEGYRTRTVGIIGICAWWAISAIWKDR